MKKKVEVQKQDNQKILVDDWLEAIIYEPKSKLNKIFRSNSVSEWGKIELAKLLGGLGGSPIDCMRLRFSDNTWTTIPVNNERLDNTLAITGISTLQGTYNLVFCANSSDSDSEHYHNSINTSVPLDGVGTVTFVVRFVFSGLEPWFGGLVCASRLGGIGDTYDNPVDNLSTNLGYTVPCQSSLDGNSLIVYNEVPLTQGGTYTTFYTKSGYLNFSAIGTFRIIMFDNCEVYCRHTMIFE